MIVRGALTLLNSIPIALGLADANEVHGRQVATATARESDEYGILESRIKRYEERTDEQERADMRQTILQETRMHKKLEHLVLIIRTVR